MEKCLKKFVAKVTGITSGGAAGTSAVYIAGQGAGRVGAVVVTHGLKVLGMGSMAVGIFSTCIIAVGTAYGVYKGMNYIMERLD